MDKLLIDPLPGDVKPFVVKQVYWLTDEAASPALHKATPPIALRDKRIMTLGLTK